MASVPKQLGGLDSHAEAHARMLVDPCNSLLEESVYPGDRGYVNRFQATNSYGVGATSTGFIAVIKPGNACSTNTDLAPGTVSVGLAYNLAAYPGAPFISSNASKTRAVSFCISIRPNAAPNTATGTIYFGIVNAAALPNGLALSPNNAIALCSDSVSASQALLNPLEVKWSPGGFDERYSSNTISDDDSDRNVLLVVATGLPVASGVNYRMVSIIEWSPQSTLGITNDATSVNRSRNTVQDVTRVLKQKDPAWWWSLGTKVAGAVSATAKGYISGGAVGAIGGLVGFM